MNSRNSTTPRNLQSQQNITQASAPLRSSESKLPRILKDGINPFSKMSDAVSRERVPGIYDLVRVDGSNFLLEF